MPIRLREATGPAHGRLERHLNLLDASPSRERFIELLKRFWGFHAAWEPALDAREELRPFMAGRYRLGLIAQDLSRIGLASDEIGALPRCTAATELASSTEAALGSVYVLEGSTLGGRIITRALQQADWLPSGGLGYFDPYGAQTGLMWRGFQEALTAMSSAEADPAIAQGAIRTFELLHDWLT